MAHMIRTSSCSEAVYLELRLSLSARTGTLHHTRFSLSNLSRISLSRISLSPRVLQSKNSFSFSFFLFLSLSLSLSLSLRPRRGDARAQRGTGRFNVEDEVWRTTERKDGARFRAPSSQARRRAFLSSSSRSSTSASRSHNSAYRVPRAVTRADRERKKYIRTRYFYSRERSEKSYLLSSCGFPGYEAVDPNVWSRRATHRALSNRSCARSTCTSPALSRSGTGRCNISKKTNPSFACFSPPHRPKSFAHHRGGERGRRRCPIPRGPLAPGRALPAAPSGCAQAGFRAGPKGATLLHRTL